MLGYAQRRELLVRDCWAGADPAHRIGVRVIPETAWHNLFARTMSLRPRREELEGFQPDFTILNLPGFQAEPKLDGTASDCAVLVNFTDRVVAICGTWYAGEIKKSVFTILNYLLPDRNVLPMHASANVGPKGDVAIFFGLSGTGKTTLSDDPSRPLLGDDEHGWGESSLFNLEGGCSAKVIKLSREAEPEIHATTERFGTVLENVVIDPARGALALDDGQHTENTRACYPLEFIPNASASGMADTPKNIVMLTADAFGVLPPVSQLSPEQAMYHFLSGYTARVAGTEKGVTEPHATFSTCFGAPFMPHHPTVYPKMLGEKMARQHVKFWLVNTGWSGGSFRRAERLSIRPPRPIVRRAPGVASAPAPAPPPPPLDGGAGAGVRFTRPDRGHRLHRRAGRCHRPRRTAAGRPGGARRRRPSRPGQEPAGSGRRTSRTDRGSRRAWPARHQFARRYARGAVGDDDQGAGDLQRGLRHLRPQDGSGHPLSRRQGHPRYDLPCRRAARSRAVP